MRVRRARVAALVLAGAVAGAVAATAPDALAASRQASGAQQTHPSVSPRVGHRHSRFELTFTLAQAPGRTGSMDSYYREVVSPPAHDPQSCSPAEPAPVVSGTRGATTEIALYPPAHGWCRGRYNVTVLLESTPVCGPPIQAAPPLGPARDIECPDSAAVDAPFFVADGDTGEAHFTVR